jgi:hypothetical protein
MVVDTAGLTSQLNRKGSEYRGKNHFSALLYLIKSH